MNRIPILRVEKLPRPDKLAAIVQKLTDDQKQQKDQRIRDSDAEGRQWLSQVHSGGNVAPSARIWRFLIHVLSSKDTTERDRDTIFRTALRHHDALSWRKLWLLWESPHGANVRFQLGDVLAQRLEQRLSQKPNFGDKIPEWLGRTPKKTFHEGLRHPAKTIYEWWTSSQVPLWELQQRIHCLTVVADGSPGKEALVRILEDPGRRWLGKDHIKLQEWTAKTGSLEVMGRVADGLLLDLRGTARSAVEMDRRVDGTRKKSLTDWVRNYLGDPPTHGGGAWRWASATAKETWHWLRLKEEFEKILGQFRKNAKESDRVRYWSNRFSEVSDAKYYGSADGTAVCMMVIRDTLVIEFGTLGNACYLYRAPTNPLLFAELPPNMVKDVFKCPNSALSLNGEKLGYRDRLSHFSGWEDRFNGKIR